LRGILLIRTDTNSAGNEMSRSFFLRLNIVHRFLHGIIHPGPVIECFSHANRLSSRAFTILVGMLAGRLSCMVVATLLAGAVAWAQASKPVPGANDIQKADRLLRAGSAAFETGDLRAAHTDFASLVRLMPRIAAAHTAYGAVLLAEGKPSAAVAELEEARRLDPNDVKAAINLGVAYRQLNQNAKAVQAFSSVADRADAALSATEAVSYAGALAATQDAAHAQTVIEEALNRNPKSAALQDALGALLAQRGAFPAAQQAFERAIFLDANLASAHTHLGSVLLILADPQEAVTEFRTAERLGDASPSLLLGLGKALTATGQDAEAVIELRKAVAASPATGDAKYPLALALQNAGDPRGALPQQPENTAVLTNYGLALMQTGDAKGALQLYQRAAAAGDASATLREDMGAAYLQENDIEHAIEQFRAGLAVAPQNVQLHYDLGLAYKLKDDLPASVIELKHAEELDPQLPDPHYTLGVIEMQLGDFTQAKAQLEQAVGLQPANGEAWSLLGSVDKQAGDAAQAEEALRRAISLLPEQPSPHITLASILAERGEKENAAAERKIAAQLSRVAVGKQRAQFALDSGRALLARGQVNEAIVQLQTAVAAQPELLDAHVALADALSRAGRDSEALSERQKVETLAKEQPGNASPR
jgi:protein O-GlcNAc transferase